MHLDFIHQCVQHDAIPLRQPRLAASNQHHARVNQLDRVRPLAGCRRVRGGGLLAHLPVAPHFVPETPVFDVVRLVSAGVFAAEICVKSMMKGSEKRAEEEGRGDVRVAGAIAVLDPIEGFAQGACAHVQDDIRLNLCDAAPRDEPGGDHDVSTLFSSMRLDRTYSSVPNRLLSSPPHANSGLRLLSSFGPTPSSQ